MSDFPYLSKQNIYLDTACQSLRPQPVIDTLQQYYTEYNSCGERVKYRWGQLTNEKVQYTRGRVLKYLKLKSRDYVVTFTLNTTYGINLLLHQMDVKKAQIKQIVTSDIEHNSPFLATMAFAKTHQLERLVLSRQPDGSLLTEQIPPHSLVVVNCVSNIDGRILSNLKEVVKHVHKTHGWIIIDAAQAMAHHAEILHKTEADAICFSAHKMYAPSLGVVVVRRDFLPLLQANFIGGGMVDDVEKDKYILSAANPDHAHTLLEPGLQAWGEIIALGTAIDWITSLPKSQHRDFTQNFTKLYDFLREHPAIKLINTQPSPVLSFYTEKIDAHLLGSALGEEGIMARTGYFCVHYYLDHVKHYPPLVRFSLGYHNRAEDIDKVIEILSNIK